MSILIFILSAVLRILYRVRITGLEHLQAPGTPVVIAPNHVSYLDAVLLAAFLPSRPVFAVNTQIAARWWVKPFLRLVDAFPVDPTNPMSTKTLIKLTASGRACVIFPEGRITRTGSLMKMYDGPGLIADRAGAALVPVRIAGAEYSPFSHLKGKLRRRLLPRLKITLLPPTTLKVPPELKGRARRQRITLALYDIMSGMMFETSSYRRTLFGALLAAARAGGRGTVILEDATRQTLTYRKLVLGSLVLGRKLERITQGGEIVGLLLPNVSATAASFFALQATGRVAAMLNFTAGPANVAAACATAAIRTVVTSRRFVEQARLEPVIAALANCRIVYLEDIRESIGIMDRLRGLLSLPFARAPRRSPDDPAVVMFTSGSEGTPKGVVLSHANLLANCRQIAARIAFNPTDKVLNALPVFHSFGLTGGLLLPLFSGVPVVLYPSPLHYRIVPELAYDSNATILFGTDTFLAGYARTASAYDFYSLRYVFAGAERVREETRRAWSTKFGLRILEGYGATETAPVIAVNTPMHCRPGTVGRVLPGVETRLEPMPGVEAGGRLWVRGPNVMLGYLKHTNPGRVEAIGDGWYDTGDIVSFDAEGYVRIEGRAKRFAKIAGEMVPLDRVEEEIATLWPENRHAVLAMADERRGEQLVLLTDRQEVTREEIQRRFRERGLPELMLPKTVRSVAAIPVLGSGKTDYAGVKALAESEAA